MATQIEACHGTAAHILKNQTVKVINTYGTQVVDTWAFTISPSKDIETQMSMQHTRASLNSLRPKVGDGLYNNERQKMFTITEDTTKGIHDTMIAACDSARYVELGGGKDHRNCADNLVEGLQILSKFERLRDIPRRAANTNLYRYQSTTVHTVATESVYEHPSP